MEKQRILEAILTMGLPCWTKTYERRPKVTEMVVLPGVLSSWRRCIYLRGQRAEWLLYIAWSWSGLLTLNEWARSGMPTKERTAMPKDDEMNWPRQNTTTVAHQAHCKTDRVQNGMIKE